MRSDSDIKRDVESELRWDPDIDSTDIAVAVKDGVVTLAGFVRSYSQRQQAEDDAKRVVGVAGVANDIEVRLPIVARRPDPQIARDAVAALRAELPVLVRTHQGGCRAGRAHTRRQSRVELFAREGRAGGTARPRGQECAQPDRTWSRSFHPPKSSAK